MTPLWKPVLYHFSHSWHCFPLDSVQLRTYSTTDKTKKAYTVLKKSMQHREKKIKSLVWNSCLQKTLCIIFNPIKISSLIHSRRDCVGERYDRERLCFQCSFTAEMNGAWDSVQLQKILMKKERVGTRSQNLMHKLFSTWRTMVEEQQ